MPGGGGGGGGGYIHGGESRQMNREEKTTLCGIVTGLFLLILHSLFPPKWLFDKDVFNGFAGSPLVNLPLNLGENVSVPINRDWCFGQEFLLQDGCDGCINRFVSSEPFLQVFTSPDAVKWSFTKVIKHDHWHHYYFRLNPDDDLDMTFTAYIMLAKARFYIDDIASSFSLAKAQSKSHPLPKDEFHFHNNRDQAFIIYLFFIGHHQSDVTITFQIQVVHKNQMMMDGLRPPHSFLPNSASTFLHLQAPFELPEGKSIPDDDVFRIFLECPSSALTTTSNLFHWICKLVCLFSIWWMVVFHFCNDSKTN